MKQWHRQDEAGASAVEYGLLVAAIAAVIALIVFALGGPTIGMFSNACSSWHSQTSTSVSCG